MENKIFTENGIEELWRLSQGVLEDGDGKKNATLENSKLSQLQVGLKELAMKEFMHIGNEIVKSAVDLLVAESRKGSYEMNCRFIK